MENSFVEAAKTLLKETFEGPSEGGSCYTESKPGSGIFGTLKNLTAEEASIPIQGTTIAAHTDHTRYYLWMLNTYMKGEEPKLDWEESWKITLVEEITWSRFKDELELQYKAILEKLETLESLEEQTQEILCSIAHSAYHLGAIRQMVKVIKVPSQT